MVPGIYTILQNYHSSLASLSLKTLHFYRADKQGLEMILHLNSLLL